jgi:hypothetical protein
MSHDHINRNEQALLALLVDSSYRESRGVPGFVRSLPGVHRESWFTPGTFWLGMRGLLGRWESLWSPRNSRESSGVYKERVGEGKDLT